MPSDPADRLLIDRIRAADPEAWKECIARYEGRLTAFVETRLRDRAASEDVVQETFLGFLVSLPNYDPNTPLETFLFSIAAHKLTDLLRRNGRRPAIPLLAGDSTGGSSEPAAKVRMASSLARSREQRAVEERVLAEGLRTLIRQWLERGEFERLKCIELLFVTGLSNKDAARTLSLSEQAVANHKHFVLGKLKEWCDRSFPGLNLAAMVGTS